MPVFVHAYGVTLLLLRYVFAVDSLGCEFPTNNSNRKFRYQNKHFSWERSTPLQRLRHFWISRETEPQLSFPPHTFIINRNTVLFHSSNPPDVSLFWLRFHTFLEIKCLSLGKKSSLVSDKDHLHHSSIGVQQGHRSTSLVFAGGVVYSYLINIRGWIWEKWCFD